MSKCTLLAASAALALMSANSVFAAGVHPAASTRHEPKHTILFPGKGTTTLYDQTSNDSGIAIVSQNFDSGSFDSYDNQAADDFTVPASHKWKIYEVDAIGTYFNGSGPADSFNVYFYKVDANGLPGKSMGSCLNQAYTDSGFGSPAIKLFGCAKHGAPPDTGCCKGLNSGTYFVSIQANQSFNAPRLPPSGEWGWENQTTAEGHSAAWQNPGGGFGVCPTWGVENVCIPDGQGDHMFALKGKDK